MEKKVILSIKNLSKKFGDKVVFENFNLDVKENEYVVIKGKSGSGKSTLLNIIGLLEKKDSGTITLFNESNVSPYSRKATHLLKEKIGYLFQNFALVDDQSVRYNLMLALDHVKMKKSEKESLISSALSDVGLSGYEDKMIYKCSGGEQQRIAIARLLIKPCDLVLCDEPTGSLDNDNKHMIFDLLDFLKAKGKTLVVVTHDDELVERSDRVVNI